MISWIIANAGTIIIGVILLAVVALIVRNMLKRSKSGQCIGCDGCDKAGGCHCSPPENPKS